MIRASLFRFPTVANFVASVLVGALLAASVIHFRSVSDQITRWKQTQIPHHQLYMDWLRSKDIHQLPDDAHFSSRNKVVCVIQWA